MKKLLWLPILTIAGTLLLVTGCASRIELERWQIPDTALRSLNIEFDPPDSHHNPKGEFGIILAIAASVAESANPVVIDTRSVEAEAEAIEQAVHEALTWDLDIPLIHAKNSRSKVSIESNDGSWVHTTAYQFDQRPEADLSVEITLSYDRTSDVPFGVDEASVGVGFVYPRAQIKVILTHRDGTTLWRDRASYRSDKAIPFGSLSFFGVELVREFSKEHSFVPIVDQAIYELVDRTLHW
jgi:hypothetical protein